MKVSTKEYNDIQSKIDAELKAENDKKRVRSGKFSPSMFGRCFRAQYWNRKDEPKSNPLDARTLRVFKCGHLFHDFVQKYFNSTEQLIETDDIKAFADIVEDDCVWDIKSQHSRAFFYMTKSNYDIMEEKKPNWLQVAFYALMLKKKFCGLVFVSKDDLCVKEYKDYTEKLRPEVEKEIATLRKFWKDDVLPSAKPRCYNGKECSYCSWKDKCEGKNGQQ